MISLCALPHTALAQISLLGERAGLETQICSQEAGRSVIPPGTEPAFQSLAALLRQVAEHTGTGSPQVITHPISPASEKGLIHHLHRGVKCCPGHQPGNTSRADSHC